MAGTTSSSGLNNLLSSTQQVQTTLPGWYDTAQQNIANQANTALTGAPAFGQTTAQSAVNTLQGTANPFTQGQSALNTIAQGAANPWIVDQATGSVTPNINTPLGGLFAAQQQQFQQNLPTLTAPTQAAGVGTGNFGSSNLVTVTNIANSTQVIISGSGITNGSVTNIFITNQTIQNNAVLQTWPEGYVYATLREYYIKRHNQADAAIYQQKFQEAWDVVEDQNNLGKWSGGHTRLTSVWQPRQYRQYNIK